VKNSGPNLDCFVNNEFARKLYFSKLYEADGEGTVSQGSKYLPPEFAEAEALGKFCSEVHRNGDAGYAGTAAVAQDLWHFIQVRAASQGRRANRATLNYYGASYGTVIGSTFAALYPNRVRRMILDGVVDANVWYQGLDFGDFRQADECVESFFDTCYMAGLRCAFNKGAKSREEIRDRFDAVLKDLEAYPIPVFNPRLVSMPVVVTIDHIRDLVFDALYNPTKSFPRVAAIFEELERRDATLFVKSKGLGQVTMKTMEGMCSLGDGVIDSQKESRDNRKKKPRRESTMETLIIPAIDAHGRYNVSNTAMWNEHKRLRVRPKYHTEVLMQGPPFYRALSISPPKSQMFDGKSMSSRLLFQSSLVSHNCRFQVRRADQDIDTYPLSHEPTRSDHPLCAENVDTLY
jgi:predicted small metal-binding protein